MTSLARRCLIGAVISVASLSNWNEVVTTDPPRTAAAAAVSVLRGIPDEQRLLAKIQRNYDSRVRPVYNSTHRVTVKFAMTLVQIIDVVSVLKVMYNLEVPG